MSTPRPPPNNSEKKNKIDAFAFFSIGRKKGTTKNDKVLVSDSDSEAEVKSIQPLKLSFNSSHGKSFAASGEENSFNGSKSFLGRHQVTFAPSSSSSDNDDDPVEDSLVDAEASNEDDADLEIVTKGLETFLVEEDEQSSDEFDESDIKEPTTPDKAAKPQRRRIVTFSSSSSSEEDKDNNSFDLGAIKKKYTPKPSRSRKLVCESSDEETEDDYDDSFIDDDQPEESTNDADEDLEILSNESEESTNDADEDLEVSKESESDISISHADELHKEKKKSSQISQAATPRVVQSKTFLDSLTHEYIEQRTHPLAIQYIKSYSRLKIGLSDLLYKMYNSRIFEGLLPSDMKLNWSKTLRKTAGTCRQSKKDDERYCEINLSMKVLTSADRLRDTLIHEMCHAAAWLITGYRGGHGPIWKNWAQLSMKAFPELPIVSRCHNYSIEYKFAYVCEKCGHPYKRHSKSIDTTRKICSKTDKGRLVLHIMDKKLGKYVSYDQPNSTDRPPKTPNAFAAFVKDNYKHCRTHGRTHGDAMKVLSNMFADTKISKD